MTEGRSPRHGERIVDLRRLLTMTQAELAQKTGIPQPNLSNLERGKHELTASMAFRIGQATGTPLDFFGYESPSYSSDDINFRKSSRVSAKGRDFVVQAFKEIERMSNSLAYAPARLKSIDLPVAEELDIVEESDVELLAQDARDALGLKRDEPVRNVIRAIERAGVAVAPIPAPSEDNLSLLDGHCGLSRWSNGAPRATIAFIAGQSGDRQRFTVAHELGHALCHAQRTVPADRREVEANLFAGAFLLPKDVALQNLSETLTLHGFMRVKAQYGISIQAAIARGRRLGVISPQRQKSLMIQISSRGWRKNEPISVGPENPIRLWTELVAMYGPNPYFGASKDLGLPPGLLKQWIPSRDTSPMKTKSSGGSEVISLAGRSRKGR
ncbi:XRE family transcriptional regulator [Rhodococcus qingshengii]|uniref:XRE family transcriptional regulator n=1 Tax=Rhodococcus qingshengii TaxID=334542 RepID=UPI0037C62E40